MFLYFKPTWYLNTQVVLNNNRNSITDQKCPSSSDLKDKSLCFDPLAKENKTSEAGDEDIKSNCENSSTKSVLVDESFTDSSTGDVACSNSSNALSSSRTLHFSINKNNQLKKLVLN